MVFVPAMVVGTWCVNKRRLRVEKGRSTGSSVGRTRNVPYSGKEKRPWATKLQRAHGRSRVVGGHGAETITVGIT